MEGFEIKINNEELITVTSDKLVTVFIDAEDICISGLDSKLDRLIWFEKKIKIGDKIKIKVTAIDNVSPLKKRYPADRYELKERYYKLKKELENKELI